MICSFLRKIGSKINAWQIRMVALACLVIFVGGGSQALANAFAASYIPHTISVQTVTQVPRTTMPDVRLSCSAVMKRTAAGIDVDTAAHYAFTLRCVPFQPDRRVTTSAHNHK